MIKTLGIALMTLMIPLSLAAVVWQTARYSQVEADLARMEREQHDVIALNRRLISGISVLSAPERIERVATENLGMRKALPAEIMRIELKKGDLGG